jgi:TolB-like protein
MLLFTLLLGATPQATLVLELTPVGIPPGIKKDLDTALSAEVAARKSLAVVSHATLKREVAAGCEQDTECLIRLAEAAEAGLVISGSVGRVGEELILSISLIDAGRALPVNRTAATGSVGSLVRQMPVLVAELFGEATTVSSTASISLRDDPRFVVLDFSAAGISEALAKNLTHVVAAELKRIDGASVLSRDDISSMVGTQQLKSVLVGECDRACFVEIAGALDADYLLVGQVGRLGDTYVAGLSLLDQVDLEGADQRRVTETYRGDESELIRAIRHATRRLLGLEPHQTGTLSVGANESEVRVFLDETLLGELPLPPKTDVRGGHHTVRLEKNGYFDWQSELYVNGGDTTVVWAELQPKPEQWYEKWWVWTIVGVAVVGATAGVVAATQANDPTGTVGVTIE